MGIEYLNNPTFEKIIERFRQAEKSKKRKTSEYEEAQLELAKAFYILAKNIISAFRFQLVDKEDALQEGVWICFEKLHRFDPNIGRAFNFCTTIILNHYRQLYRTAKNYNELRVRYHDYLCEKTDELYLHTTKAKRNRANYRREETND